MTSTIEATNRGLTNGQLLENRRGRTKGENRRASGQLKDRIAYGGAKEPEV